ncbi:MAG: DUF1648 domain-containing protein, partial [Bacteroidia bacterium]|nr:DUF1648 domain-containing protein [Bacteroidia bacterium]
MDRIMDLLTLGLFIMNAIILIFALVKLPYRIPNHLNLKNEIDGYGNKFTLIIPFLIGTILCSVLYFLESRQGFYKDTMNRIKTQEQFQMAMKTVISLKPLLAYVFLMISVLMIQTAQYKWVNYSNYFVFLVLAPFPFHIVYWLYKY